MVNIIYKKGIENSVQKYKSRIFDIISGFFIGISDTIPGVSGATIALIIGIYEDLIKSVRELNIRYLIPIIIGVVIGWLAGVEAVVPAYENYPLHVSAFFFGLILASVYRPLKECKKRGLKEILTGIMGFFITVLITFFAVGIEGETLATSLPLWYIFICGFFALMAMAVPGVSGSMVLLILGAYLAIMGTVRGFAHAFFDALGEFSLGSIFGLFETEEFFILLIFGVGALFGLFFAIFAVSSVIKEHRDTVLPFFVGMIIGSLSAVSKPLFESPDQITISVLASLILGFVIVTSILYAEGRFRGKNKQPSN